MQWWLEYVFVQSPSVDRASHNIHLLISRTKHEEIYWVNEWVGFHRSKFCLLDVPWLGIPPNGLRLLHNEREKITFFQSIQRQPQRLAYLQGVDLKTPLCCSGKEWTQREPRYPAPTCSIPPGVSKFIHFLSVSDLATSQDRLEEWASVTCLWRK